eukprot:CAMPEP_0194083032 /NCGR_PEP_ID=MMETSP0149-20130528/8384_1 /TAXON_ID=122233 /ORGANISM="Chaetoceros debilis, Strain MM31A-1" /LENGTH=499 /DNA_ID=CAMNT_0038765329 /DNA_START=76 /DNA_END=1572 /DNA_ORIENTATION=-
MMRLKRQQVKKRSKCSLVHYFISLIISFMLGCVLCMTVLLNREALRNDDILSSTHHQLNNGIHLPPGFSQQTSTSTLTPTSSQQMKIASSVDVASAGGGRGGVVLAGLRILVAIASYDFSQFPLLEEVLDSYQDACVAGAHVDLYIHTVVPYTVALIDLLNARYSCDGLEITIAVQSPAVRLNLVDRHRTLFYDNIEEYDLFIYSEDDIKVSPTTIMAYLEETKRVEKLVGKSPAEDYNVGIVRYEYNYPPDIVIDDKTRHATESVTRVYWEHLWKPLFPKSIDFVPQEEVKKKYVSMQNHHQGMYLATQDLLKAWQKRKGCQFDVVRQRPGRKDNPGQPTEGTQRVWMSSQMLHGSRHCNVQQLIPTKNFGQLTVWHLPNKNYRRVGKKGRIGGTDSSVENEFGTGKEKFRGPDKSLPTEMELHLQMRQIQPMEATPGNKYIGIKMIDEVDRSRKFRKTAVGEYRPYLALLQERMDAYESYIHRGGILGDKDFEDWQW